MTTPPPLTNVDRIPRRPGAGTDVVVKANVPDDVARYWVEGDTYPRIVLDVANHSILLGDGTAAPVAVAVAAAAFPLSQTDGADLVKVWVPTAGKLELKASNATLDSHIHVRNDFASSISAIEQYVYNGTHEVLNAITATNGTDQCSWQLRMDGNDVITAARRAVGGLRLGFFGATRVNQPVAIPDAAGGAIIDAEGRTALNALLAAVRALGLIAT